MRKATSSLLRFIGVPERTGSPDWWTYFGSFGNDIFDDEDPQMRSTSTPDGATFRYPGIVAETTGVSNCRPVSLDVETYGVCRSDRARTGGGGHLLFGSFSRN